jgi:hypothetical protein
VTAGVTTVTGSPALPVVSRSAVDGTPEADGTPEEAVGETFTAPAPRPWSGVESTRTAAPVPSVLRTATVTGTPLTVAAGRSRPDVQRRAVVVPTGTDPVRALLGAPWGGHRAGSRPEPIGRHHPVTHDGPPPVQRLADGGANGGAEAGTEAGPRLVLDTHPQPEAAEAPGSTGVTGESVPRQETVQRQEPAAAPATEPAPAAAPGAPAAPGAGTPGSAGAATPEQLEELARRLVAPLARRLKAEMLLDRERRGLRTDTR